MAELAPELVELLLSKLSSIEQVDVFVLLFRSAERDWSPQEVAAALNVAPQSAGMRLFLLSSAGLLAASGSGASQRYAYVHNPALDSIADMVAQTHAAERPALAALLSPSPGSPAQLFADAFRLKKP
jgi:hypothetical protein